MIMARNLAAFFRGSVVEMNFYSKHLPLKVYHEFGNYPIRLDKCILYHSNQSSNDWKKWEKRSLMYESLTWSFRLNLLRPKLRVSNHALIGQDQNFSILLFLFFYRFLYSRQQQALHLLCDEQHRIASFDSARRHCQSWNGGEDGRMCEYVTAAQSTGVGSHDGRPLRGDRVWRHPRALPVLCYTGQHIRTWVDSSRKLWLHVLLSQRLQHLWQLSITQ